MEIDPSEVETVFLDCLFREEEIKDEKLPESAVIAQGLIFRVGFHQERLKSHSAKVRGWLDALPEQFHEEHGGGWSFLNACETAAGVKWTDLHQRADQLLTLGVALGMVKWLLYNERAILPGGMPYVVVVKAPPALTSTPEE